jgi:predicted Zn-dependent protease
MRKTVKELVSRKRNELHNNIIIPQEQGQLETDHLIEKTLGETTVQRYKRLSMEHEDLYNNQEKAEEYVVKLCEEMEGDQDALLEAAKFYLRKGDAYADKAEQNLRNAYSFGMKNQTVAFMYACLLV